MSTLIKYMTGFMLVVFMCLAASESLALHEVFKELDVDKSGQVDRNEFSQDMKENAFKKLDANDDKGITQEEWEGLADISDREKHRELFKTIDKNKDRRITFFEFSNYADMHSNIDEAFIGLDKDRNNSLSPDELRVRPLFKMITIYF